MNREIKFRAWDGNRMRDVFKILFTETDGLIIYFKSTESGKEPGHLIERDSRLKLMQYTGLKDKNGKEIYEGDKTVRGYVIMWSENKALFCEHYYQSYFNEWTEASYPIDANSIEIIGNIYENPELLTQSSNAV